MCLLEVLVLVLQIVELPFYIKYFLHLKKEWLLNGVDSSSVGKKAQQTCFQGPSEVIHSIKSIVSPNQHVELQDFVFLVPSQVYLLQLLKYQ